MLMKRLGAPIFRVWLSPCDAKLDRAIKVFLPNSGASKSPCSKARVCGEPWLLMHSFGQRKFLDANPLAENREFIFFKKIKFQPRAEALN